MKKLHAIKSNPLKVFSEYAQVKNNFVYVTNGNVLLKIPAEEVFGKEVIQPEDELYFKLEMWSLLKFHTAKQIWREGNSFRNSHGLTYDAISAKAFKEYAVFPACDIVLPDRQKPVTEINRYGIDASEYFNLISAWGVRDSVRMWFYGESKGCILESKNSKGLAYLMPLDPGHESWDDFESYPQTQAENIDDLL